MERLKVNNISSLFLIRYFATVLLCFLTLFITGRIADMDFLLGNLEYAAGGLSTSLAKNAFAFLRPIGNIYLIISIITGLGSFILFYLLKNFIDRNNIGLWKVCLFCPGLLIYTNSGTKETLFLYPAILFIILEVNFLLGKSKSGASFLNFLIKIFLLILMFLIRGDLAIPYALLSLFSLFVKTFYLGGISSKLHFKNLLLKSYFISIVFVSLFTFLYPENFERIIEYITLSFESKTSLYRPVIDINFVKNPLNSIQVQYLSLFPTPLELLNKPHKALIIIDSILLIYIFNNSWKLLFKSINSFKGLKKIISIFFTLIAVTYFSIYGILGSFNLGSSQRLRINYFPLGIVFPLILEKEIRNIAKREYIQS